MAETEKRDPPELQIHQYAIAIDMIVSATGPRDAARVAGDLARSGVAMRVSVIRLADIEPEPAGEAPHHPRTFTIPRA